MTLATGYEYAMRKIREFGGGHITSWGSMPCAGGSPWQCVNEVKYYRSGDERSLGRLRGLRATFRRLFLAFQDLTEEVTWKMGTACPEWPTSCQYWRGPEVREYVLTYSLTRANLHGCAYGLKN